jgi:uncharacterized protein (DUF1330 family)
VRWWKFTAFSAERRSLLQEEAMTKAYLILCYHSVSDDNALQEYAKLALPAIQSAGGRYLARGLPARTYEEGLNQRTVLIEFDSVEQAITAHDSSGYQTALRALGNAARRDVRIVEGVS